MNIYVAHSTSFDFQKELYGPIKSCSLNKEHVFIFPHDVSSESFHSKEFFQKDCDLVIAEVSYPSTGLGIELGWADMLHVPIVCIAEKGSSVSGALHSVTETFLEYSDTKELLEKIEATIKTLPEKYQ